MGIKICYVFLLIGTAISFNSSAQFYNINTIAGDSIAGFAGDNNTAIAAELNYPAGVAIDSIGNIYIADALNNRVRKLSTSGIITTIAGDGINGFAGDNSLATAAELNNPNGVALDRTGNLYIVDTYNNRIRMVNASGIITTIAGDGTKGFAGDYGLATAAELYNPNGMTLDDSNNIYIADASNCRVRKVNTSGIITTIAGNGTIGFAGDSGAATDAEISPWNVAIDASGNIYIADGDNCRIRKVNLSGIITTIAGTGVHGYSGDNGAATNASFDYPIDVVPDGSGNVYIADANNERVRMINTNGIVNTIAGNGAHGFMGDNGVATIAELYGPASLVLGGSGNIYIADQFNNRIRELTLITGINEISNDIKNVRCYPNPNKGVFNIDLGDFSTKINVEVFNIFGEKLFTTTLQYVEGNAKIDIATQPNGIYLYRATSEQGSLVAIGKFIIEK